MLPRLRNVVSDLVLWLRGHWLVSLLVLLGLAGLGVGVYLAVSDDSEPETVNTPPAPRVVIKEDAPAPEEPTDLGFPAFATKNTTRVAGADPIGDAAGSALAVYPSTGGVEGPDAVTLVDADDWQAGVAAASLVAAPVSAPILIGDGGELPELTATAIRSLAPGGVVGDRRPAGVRDRRRPAPRRLRRRAGQGLGPRHRGRGDRPAPHRARRRAGPRARRQLRGAGAGDARRGLGRPLR